MQNIQRVTLVAPTIRLVTAIMALACLVLLATRVDAAPISAAEAANHIGETVTVEGVASEVFTDRRSGVTFIDLGGRYPNNTFTGVVFRNSAGSFPNVHQLEGRTVGITGRIRLYKGRPEIILRSRSQLSDR